MYLFCDSLLQINVKSPGCDGWLLLPQKYLCTYNFLEHF